MQGGVTKPGSVFADAESINGDAEGPFEAADALKEAGQDSKTSSSGMVGGVLVLPPLELLPGAGAQSESLCFICFWSMSLTFGEFSKEVGGSTFALAFAPAFAPAFAFDLTAACFTMAEVVWSADSARGARCTRQ